MNLQEAREFDNAIARIETLEARQEVLRNETNKTWTELAEEYQEKQKEDERG